MNAAVCIIGRPARHWASLEKVYRFYCEAITMGGQLRLIANPDQADARIFFRLSEQDLWRLGTGTPHLVALHGSCVLDRSRVRQILSQLRPCDGVIVTCTSDRAIVQSMLRERGPEIIELRIATNITAPSSARTVLRKALGMSKNTRIITFVGRLIPHKNAHIFLELIAWLRGRINVCGIIIGDYWDDYPAGIPGAAYRRRLSDLFEQANLGKVLLRFHAAFSDSELALFLGGSDLIFHPSLTPDENYGIVPVEAIVSGTPVICTDYGGMKDNVISGVSGWRARTWCTQTGPRADFNSMFHACQKLLTNRKALQELRTGCSNQARNYGVPVCASNLVTALSRMITGKRCAPCGPDGLNLESPSSLPSRWTHASYPDAWKDTHASVAHYTSHQRLPRIEEFRAVAKYGNQEIHHGRLHVRDELGDFSGPLKQEEETLLTGLGYRWIDVSSLHMSERSVADSLLKAGVLKATRSQLYG